MSNVPSIRAIPDERFRKEVEERVGRTLCQRYTLEELLGVGAAGAVYRGSHRNGNRVAVKVLHSELAASAGLRERFLTDAKAVNQVAHPGAVRILDDDTAEDGTTFLVMDLLEGKTLEQMLATSNGRLPSAEVVRIAGELLDVLASAHEKGVVHRALEPANVFVTSSGAVKVMGFGTSRLAEGSILAARLGRAMETAAFVSPEQARGESALVDAQTDLWSVGALMFRALAGRAVYEGVTPELVRVHAATQEPPALRSTSAEVAPDVAEIVDRALAVKKEDRWMKATAMAAALRSVHPAGATSASAPPAAVVPRTAMHTAPMTAVPFPSSPPPAAGPSAAPTANVPPLQQQQPQQQQQQVGQTASAGPPPLQPIPNFGPMPTAEDNGWIKWVAAVAVLIVFVVVAGGAAAFFLIRRASHNPKLDPTTTAKVAAWSDGDSPVPVSSRDPVWGNRDALVTVVVFSDFQCPFCSRVEPTLEQVKSTYGPEKVRLVWKNEPLAFHPNAKPAAEAAQVVFSLKGSNAFFAFHDLAFQNQSSLSPEMYRTWALEAGVDGKAYDKALATHDALRKIDEDHAVATKVGVNGTPAFRINGLELSGAQPIDKFKSMIDAELAKAATALAAGTAKDKLYVVLSTQNVAAAPAKKPTTDDPPADTTTVWRVPVAGSPVRGNVDAPVTIVEFGDFQCPFCKRAQPTIDKVRDTYGTKVRIVWKNEPLAFHPRARPAAELALEARAEKGDAGFWRAHDKLFDAQPKLEDDDLFDMGTQLGLAAPKVKAAIRDKKHDKEIEDDVELADDLQATGTPSFFINGRHLVGAQPFDKFEKIIDEELRKFDAQQGSVSAKDYYASLMRDAKGPPEPEKKHAPAVPAGAPFRGGANAKVVIQEWADFQCPFCARAEPTIAEVLKTYGDKVKVVWRDKPLGTLHPDAALAAEVAREALAQRGPDGFWKMHDKLFANQQKLKRDDLETYAGDLNLDVTKLGRSLDSHSHKEVIDADDRLGTDLGITGTPAFLINSYYLSGAQPFPKFKRLIDRALAESGK